MLNVFRWIFFFSLWFLVGIIFEIFNRTLVSVFDFDPPLSSYIIIPILGVVIWIFLFAKKIKKRRINKKIEEKQTQQEVTKLQSAKTGEPIELTGYGIIGSDGKDTGKRFVRREDAEKYSKSIR